MAKGKYAPWLESDGLLLLESWARDGLTDEEIAAKVGITATTLYVWLKKYPEISEAIKKGKEIVDIQVENALLKKALGGFEITEKTYERIDDTRQAKRHAESQPLTEKEWETAQAYFDHKCCYCGKPAPLTKDHLVPLSKGGRMELTNIVPACQSCNSSKKDNQWAGWYTKRPFFDKSRYQKIMEYIRFASELQPLVAPSGGEEDLVVTKKVVKQLPPDVAAMIFWLRNRRPDKWRGNRDTEHAGNALHATGNDPITAALQEAFKDGNQ